MTNKELQEELKKFPDDIEVGIWEPYKKPYIATIGYIDKHDGEMKPLLWPYDCQKVGFSGNRSRKSRG